MKAMTAVNVNNDPSDNHGKLHTSTGALCKFCIALLHVSLSNSLTNIVLWCLFFSEQTIYTKHAVNQLTKNYSFIWKSDQHTQQMQNDCSNSQEKIVHNIVIVGLGLFRQVACGEDNDCIQTISIIAWKQWTFLWTSCSLNICIASQFLSGQHG